MSSRMRRLVRQLRKFGGKSAVSESQQRYCGKRINRKGWTWIATERVAVFMRSQGIGGRHSKFRWCKALVEVTWAEKSFVDSRNVVQREFVDILVHANNI